MFKTLASLAGAMTATSALLGWMDPAPFVQDGVSSDDIRDEARSRVCDDVAVLPGRWHFVEIHAGPETLTRGPLLTARPASHTHHFRIDLDGRITRSERWRRQEPVELLEGTVLIEVATAGPDRPMAGYQWNCVRMLVSALYEAGAVNDPIVPVRFTGAWARAHGLTEGATLPVNSQIPGADRS